MEIFEIIIKSSAHGPCISLVMSTAGGKLRGTQMVGLAQEVEAIGDPNQSVRLDSQQCPIWLRMHIKP